ncbi:uncharacterized protein LOC106180577 [Lingula anatina]|uniref:Uncharacterized protein LOC106180577 n=1 Tax=Lingula anatina TaxID=7574 RepID=A0A1S3KC83_LINAN|nr:uncharacterized protein LOC106180577 [Lingula anatina]|eukprot:XP_013420049.1 uncharacterized protein LOC106180577 [Lingula anatina]
MASLRASGTAEEYDERTQLLTELANLDEEKMVKKQEDNKCTDDKETQGKAIRQAAMENLKVKKQKGDLDVVGHNEDNHDHCNKTENCDNIPPTKKRRTDSSADYVSYLKDRLAFEKERFELEKKEREAQIEKDKHMMEMVMSLVKKKN